MYKYLCILIQTYIYIYVKKNKIINSKLFECTKLNNELYKIHHYYNNNNNHTK